MQDFAPGCFDLLAAGESILGIALLELFQFALARLFESSFLDIGDCTCSDSSSCRCLASLRRESSIVLLSNFLLS
jgi:hypothetical protein